jgi:hypothetical protein
MREQPSRTALRTLARVGYSAEGIVYLAVGALAAIAAVSSSREAPGAESALQIASAATIGTELLWAVGIGLAALALWDLLVAVLDIEAHGWHGRALLRRLSTGLAALFHGALASWAIHRATGRSAPAGDQAADQAAATVMEQPLGRWLLIGFAVMIFLFVFAEIAEAWGPGITDRLGAALTRRARRISALVGRIGVTARAAVIGVMGWFLLRAALLNRPTEARALGGSLEALDVRTIGPLVLGSIALGLALYGFWQLLNAMLARVEVH